MLTYIIFQPNYTNPNHIKHLPNKNDIKLAQNPNLLKTLFFTPRQYLNSLQLLHCF